jgi:putative endonuclease
MPSSYQQKGTRAERLAQNYLSLKGYTILAKNYRSRLGEIDIIAKENGKIVFIEVKAKYSMRFGSPKWAVTYQKQKKLSILALEYLKSTGQSQAEARFDVIAIVYLKDSPPQIELVKNAFELAYR